MSDADRSDPAVRVAATLERQLTREMAVRTAAMLALVAAAVAVPAVTGDLAAEDGPVVGAMALGAALATLAYAVAPWTPSAGERRHRELEAIWRELRTDADERVPWVRYGVWAVAHEDVVRLQMVSCGRSAPGRPQFLRVDTVREVDGGDPDAAVAATEAVRAHARRSEEANRQAYLEARQRERDERDAAALRAVEADAARYAREVEEQLAVELATEERAERRSRADALARALRRR